MFDKYTARICGEIQDSRSNAERLGAVIESTADSIYIGGGTPTLLDVAQLDRVFVTIRQNFAMDAKAEITVECAPGTLSEAMIACLVSNRVNRVSLGVQSFADQEARSVGRLHSRDVVMRDIERLRKAGIPNINVDLIAGLPHQTPKSWEQSLDELNASGVPHASVYMLEVDEDSRLGRELIAGGQKYHAHFVPDEDATADMYEIACEKLNAAGVEQYEISNFARAGFESKHNLKYWTRQPYLGFGVDAHSMLLLAGNRAVRLSNSDILESYLAAANQTSSSVSNEAALEEAFFLGLRLNLGLNLGALSGQFGVEPVAGYREIIAEQISAGTLVRDGDWIRLSARGRLLSNEVFQSFISVASI